MDNKTFDVSERRGGTPVNEEVDKIQINLPEPIDKDRFFYKFAVTPKNKLSKIEKEKVNMKWNGCELEWSDSPDMFSYHYALHYYYTTLSDGQMPGSLFSLCITNSKSTNINKYGNVEMCAVFNDDVKKVIITEDMTFINLPGSVEELIYLGPKPKKITICYPAGREDLERQIKE